NPHHTVFRLPVIFFHQSTTTTQIFTLSLHAALPICSPTCAATASSSSTNPTPSATIHDRTTGRYRTTFNATTAVSCFSPPPLTTDRKSTRLNSSHVKKSYAVFCLKKQIKIIKRSQKS